MEELNQAPKLQIETAVGATALQVEPIAVDPNYKPILPWDNSGMTQTEGASGTGRGL